MIYTKGNYYMKRLLAPTVAALVLSAACKTNSSEESHLKDVTLQRTGQLPQMVYLDRDTNFVHWVACPKEVADKSGAENLSRADCNAENAPINPRTGKPMRTKLEYGIYKAHLRNHVLENGISDQELAELKERVKEGRATIDSLVSQEQNKTIGEVEFRRRATAAKTELDRLEQRLEDRRGLQGGISMKDLLIALEATGSMKVGFSGASATVLLAPFKLQRDLARSEQQNDSRDSAGGRTPVGSDGRDQAFPSFGVPVPTVSDFSSCRVWSRSVEEIDGLIARANITTIPSPWGQPGIFQALLPERLVYVVLERDLFHYINSYRNQYVGKGATPAAAQDDLRRKIFRESQCDGNYKALYQSKLGSWSPTVTRCVEIGKLSRDRVRTSFREEVGPGPYPGGYNVGWCAKSDYSFSIRRVRNNGQRTRPTSFNLDEQFCAPSKAEAAARSQAEVFAVATDMASLVSQTLGCPGDGGAVRIDGPATPIPFQQPPVFNGPVITEPSQGLPGPLEGLSAPGASPVPAQPGTQVGEPEAFIRD